MGAKLLDAIVTDDQEEEDGEGSREGDEEGWTASSDIPSDVSAVVEDADGSLDDGAMDDCSLGEADVEVIADTIVDDTVLFLIHIFHVTIQVSGFHTISIVPQIIVFVGVIHIFYTGIEILTSGLIAVFIW